ncbi:MAG: hypothetical protein ACI84R_000945 [Candidatus Azotimanducaceae bacterium]|jgi:hypothetical protein
MTPATNYGWYTQKRTLYEMYRASCLNLKKVSNMTDAASEIILHNYPQSPVAEKARVALGTGGVIQKLAKCVRFFIYAGVQIEFSAFKQLQGADRDYRLGETPIRKAGNTGPRKLFVSRCCDKIRMSGLQVHSAMV